MKGLVFFSCVVATAAFAPAQSATSWVVPQAFANQNASATNSFPWTYTGYVRYMQVIDRSEIGGPAILEGLSLRPRNWGSGQQKPFTLDFSIRLSSSAKPVGQLDSTYANNIKGQQTEVYRGPIYFHTPSGKTPAEFSVTIPFSTRYVYTSLDPLLVDIEPISPPAGGGTSQGSDFDPTAATMQCLFGKSKVTGSPSNGGYVMKFWGQTMYEYGYGCPGSTGQPQIGSLGGAPVLGNGNFIVQVQNALPGSAAVLILGFSRDFFASSVPLPLDLAPLSTSGCWLWTDLAVTGVAPTNAAGTGLIPFPIPNDSRFRDIELYFQWSVIDAQANPGGLSFTPAGLAKLR